MRQDDLNQPLGQPQQPPGAPEPFNWRRAALVVAAIAAGSGAGYLWVTDDGRGGEPQAVAQIRKTEPAPQQLAANGGNAATPGKITVRSGMPPGVAAGSDPSPTGSIRVRYDDPRMTGPQAEQQSGVKVIRRDGGNAPGAMIIAVPQNPGVSLTPAPDRRLVEKSAHGLLPKTGSGDEKARDIYARPVVVPDGLQSNSPRVAIAIGGMGLSRTATRKALSRLPRAVTLAFAPYGPNLKAQVARARELGHEVLLQVPMEPFDLAGDGPGPRMLRTSQDKTRLRDNLHWMMARFPGYVGIANFLGAKFASEAKALTPVIAETGRRGLLYFDDGSSPRSLARNIARSLQVPFVRADVLIDAARDEKSIRAALTRLEALARSKGRAAGFANGLPDTVEAVAAFVRGLEKRGVMLVPVSSLAGDTTAVTAGNR